MSKIKIIKTKGPDICELGRGVYGKVCVYKSINGKKYAVKDTINSENNNNLRIERNIHINFFYSLPSYYKRFFVKPYYVQFEGEKKRHNYKYAMEIVPSVKTAHDYLDYLYRNNMFIKLKIVIRRIRHSLYVLWKNDIIHGDLHLKNILINTKSNMPKIIDFGLVQKSKFKIPLKTLKTRGTTHLEILNKKIDKWFKREFKRISESSNMTISNPNAIFFQDAVARNDYYSLTNYNKVQKYIKKIKNI